MRVLPGVESIEICHREQIPGKQIIAMQGPFGTELNEALIRQYDIGVLVTKESGQAGGFPEKIRAGRAHENPGGRDSESGAGGRDEHGKVLSEIETLCGKKSGTKRQPLQISLVGIGMGNGKLLTGEAGRRLHRRRRSAERSGCCRGGYPDRAGCRETGGVPSADLLPYTYSCGKENRADCHLYFPAIPDFTAAPRGGV